MSATKTASSQSKKEKFSLVPAAVQRRLYDLALRSILVREILGHAGEVHSDFAEIGAISAFQASDPVFPAHLSIGARVARSTDLGAAIDSIENSRNSHEFEQVFSGQLNPIESLLATALPRLIREPERILVVSTGELSSRSQWDSVFRFVGRHRIPVLFIVAAHYHSRRESSPDLRTVYAEFGIPVITIDGNDAVAAYRVATEARYNVRAGRGATILEASMILTANRQVNSQAPLDHLEEYMQRHGTWDKDWRSEIESAARAELKSIEERSA